METGEEGERDWQGGCRTSLTFDGNPVSLSTLFWWSFERWVLLQKEKNYTNFLRRNQGGKWNVLKLVDLFPTVVKITKDREALKSRSLQR